MRGNPGEEGLEADNSNMTEGDGRITDAMMADALQQVVWRGHSRWSVCSASPIRLRYLQIALKRLVKFKVGSKFYGIKHGDRFWPVFVAAGSVFRADHLVFWLLLCNGSTRWIVLGSLLSFQALDRTILTVCRLRSSLFSALMAASRSLFSSAVPCLINSSTDITPVHRSLFSLLCLATSQLVRINVMMKAIALLRICVLRL